MFNLSGDRVAQIKFSEEAGSSDKMNLEGMSKQGPAPKNVHKLFCNAQAESVEFVTEHSEESRPTMHINAEVQLMSLITCFVKKSAHLQTEITADQTDSQGLHLRHPRYGEDPDTGWSRGTQILGA